LACTGQNWHTGVFLHWVPGPKGFYSSVCFCHTGDQKQVTLLDLPIWFNDDVVNAVIIIIAELYLLADNGLVERGSDVKKVLVKKFGMPFNTWKEIVEKYRIKRLRFKVDYFLDC
jgi:hypothetical protein